MATWQYNPIMEWWDTRIYTGHAAASWMRITDHNRTPLNVSYERIENKQRMVDGTMRRFTVAKKRSWSCSWSNLPSQKGTLLVNGEAAAWMEQFHLDTDGSFLMRLRAGADANTATASLATSQEYKVIIADFSKEIAKRGPNTDLWNVDLTLEEV